MIARTKGDSIAKWDFRWSEKIASRLRAFRDTWKGTGRGYHGRTLLDQVLLRPHVANRKLKHRPKGQEKASPRDEDSKNRDSLVES